MGNLLTSCDFCKNCKFYIAHYVKEKTRFRTVMGHCSNNEKTARYKRVTFYSDDSCEHFIQREATADEQKASVFDTIYKMQNQLTKLLEILENTE